jgi:hypothetical protein
MAQRLEFASLEQIETVPPELIMAVESALSEVDSAFMEGNLTVPEKLLDVRREAKAPNGGDAANMLIA